MEKEMLFSIYKINTNRFMSNKDVKRLAPQKRGAKITEIILEEVRTMIEGKEGSSQSDINYDGFKGVVYRTTNMPDWKDAIKSIISTPLKFDLENANVSYILLYTVDTCVYAMTAGFGSHLIKSYIEKDWGLYLLPKIMGADEVGIREVKENTIHGNTLSVSKANRKTTNITSEKKLSAVFREFSIEVNPKTVKCLGISSSKITIIRLTDSLVLRKPMCLKDLKSVLEKVNKTEKRKDKYSLGYLEKSQKIGITNKELLSELQDGLLAGKMDNFNIVGEDYIKYYIDASSYYVLDECGNEIISSTDPITLDGIIGFMVGSKKLTTSYINTMLKRWKITAKDSSGNEVLKPIRILEALQGSLVYGPDNIPCFLIQGEWYCINERYISILNKEFSDKTKCYDKTISKIRTKFNLKSSKKNEDEYNDSFFGNKKIIVAHKSLIDNCEIADMIFCDGRTLYLMCNKMHFDASGSRDLTNQIFAAANYLQKRLSSKDRNDFLKEYYRRIDERYKGLGHKLSVDLTEFKKMFDLDIVYVAGYMTGYSTKSKSYYAKFLDIDCSKRLSDMGYGYVSADVAKLRK